MTTINMTAIVILVFVAFSGAAFAQDSAPSNRLATGSDPDSVPDWFYTCCNESPSPPGAGRSNREGRVLKKGFLAPSTSDRQSLTRFLSLPHTGLFRLLPREVYDSQYAHPKTPVKIRGGGAYYSFVNLTHQYGYGSDIELDHNRVS